MFSSGLRHKFKVRSLASACMDGSFALFRG